MDYETHGGHGIANPIPRLRNSWTILPMSFVVIYTIVLGYIKEHDTRINPNLVLCFSAASKKRERGRVLTAVFLGRDSKAGKRR